MDILATPAQRRAGKPMNKTPSESTGRILIVEDEHDLAELLRFNLKREGYETHWAQTGEQAVQLCRQHLPDLVLLDLMLPKMDGLDVCKRLKNNPETSAISIIMVTAKGEEADIVTGLELGADDYIAKPFSPRVLMARVRAVMRRRESENQPEVVPEDKPIVRDKLEIYPERHMVLCEGRPVELTATEFRLLMLLVRRPGRVFTRQQIIEQIHGGQSAVTDRSVDVQVVSLRRKLDDEGDLIQTIRGVGYRFRE
ncbi:MAG: response regulator transcription factor [Phycisphaerales bacterium]